MSGYDDEQREQEDQIWPWLASDVMADWYDDYLGESYSWQNDDDCEFDDSEKFDTEGSGYNADHDGSPEFDVSGGL